MVLKVARSSQELYTISELPTDFISGVAAALTVEVETDVLQIWLYSKLSSELIYIPPKQEFHTNRFKKNSLFFSFPLHLGSGF